MNAAVSSPPVNFVLGDEEEDFFTATDENGVCATPIAGRCVALRVTARGPICRDLPDPFTGSIRTGSFLHKVAGGVSPSVKDPRSPY
jgi:hypothetical protein